MIKKITLALILFLFLALPSAVLAKRVLPRAQTTSTTTTNRAGNKPAIQVRFRDDRNAVLVNFSNLSNATEISYEFSYESNGFSLVLVQTTYVAMTPMSLTQN